MGPRKFRERALPAPQGTCDLFPAVVVSWVLLRAVQYHPEEAGPLRVPTVRMCRVYCVRAVSAWALPEAGPQRLCRLVVGRWTDGPSGGLGDQQEDPEGARSTGRNFDSDWKWAESEYFGFRADPQPFVQTLPSGCLHSAADQLD